MLAAGCKGRATDQEGAGLWKPAHSIDVTDGDGRRIRETSSPSSGDERPRITTWKWREEKSSRNRFYFRFWRQLWYLCILGVPSIHSIGKNQHSARSEKPSLQETKKRGGAKEDRKRGWENSLSETTSFSFGFQEAEDIIGLDCCVRTRRYMD